MATTETFVPNRLYEIPLADLQPDPNQPRKYLDPAALDELTESVKQQKVVSPILINQLPQTTLDDCRKNPSVPKRVLIEIAAKKQERNMIKVYEAYMVSVNPEKKPRTGGGVTKVQSALNTVKFFRSYVSWLLAIGYLRCYYFVNVEQIRSVMQKGITDMWLSYFCIFTKMTSYTERSNCCK